MLYNVSNHDHTKWSEKQLNAAKEKWGDVISIPFPQVDPTWTAFEVQNVADELVASIVGNHKFTELSGLYNNAFLVQGEMSMTFALIRSLQNKCFDVYCATSERKSIETLDTEGRTVKTSVFDFVQFREYDYFNFRCSE